MKARVKGTTNIIEVEFSAGALNACYPPYYDRENNMYYESEQLVWMDNENAEPDYWTRLEHQAGIAAMQGLIASNLDLLSHEIIEDA
ncbi:MAG: hypothetical protein II205_05065, partial [Bacteroidales bacterium]|nr:hypothetical protein [Bacteroidales bacterium]